MNFEAQQRSLRMLRWGIATLVLMEICAATAFWAVHRGTVHLTYRIVNPNTGELVPNVCAAITRARQPGFPLSTVGQVFPSLRPMLNSLKTKTVAGQQGIIKVGIAGRSLSEYTVIFAAPGYHSTEFIFCKEHDIYRFRSHDPGLPTTFLIWSTNVVTLPLRHNSAPQTANGGPFYILPPPFPPTFF